MILLLAHSSIPSIPYSPWGKITPKLIQKSKVVNISGNIYNIDKRLCTLDEDFWHLNDFWLVFSQGEYGKVGILLCADKNFAVTNSYKLYNFFSQIWSNQLNNFKSLCLQRSTDLNPTIISQNYLTVLPTTWVIRPLFTKPTPQYQNRPFIFSFPLEKSIKPDT